MTNLHLKRFLVEVQRQEKATKEDVQAIIDSFMHFHLRGDGLNLKTFFKYFFSDDNPPLLPSHGVSKKKKKTQFFVFSYLGFAIDSLGLRDLDLRLFTFQLGVLLFSLDWILLDPFHYSIFFYCICFLYYFNWVLGFILLQFLQKLGLLRLVLV